MTGQLHGRRLFTPTEAAEFAGTTPDQLRRLIRSGRIAARDLNAGTGKKPRYRIPAREVRRLMKEAT